MIKLPKKSNQELKTLQQEGCGAYGAGACVRETLMSPKPLKWDTACDPDIAQPKKLARVVKELENEMRTGLLFGLVHRKISQNKKDRLPNHACKFEKSKLKTALRGVNWIK